MFRVALAIVFITTSLAVAGEPNLAGRWAGRWESQSTGHEGPLRARFRETDSGQYRVVFTGRFLKVVPFRYAETLTVQGQSGDTVFLSGSSRLPGFGTFSFDATATNNSFNATFHAKRDQGTFILSR